MKLCVTDRRFRCRDLCHGLNNDRNFFAVVTMIESDDGAFGLLSFVDLSGSRKTQRGIVPLFRR